MINQTKAYKIILIYNVTSYMHVNIENNKKTKKKKKRVVHCNPYQ